MKRAPLLCFLCLISIKAQTRNACCWNTTKNQPKVYLFLKIICYFSLQYTLREYQKRTTILKFLFMKEILTSLCFLQDRFPAITSLMPKVLWSSPGSSRCCLGVVQVLLCSRYCIWDLEKTLQQKKRFFFDKFTPKSLSFQQHKA